MALTTPRLFLTQESSDSVLVSWNQIPGATMYDVFRDGDYITTNTNDEGTSYLDDGRDGPLSIGQTYEYAVTAYNGDGDISNRSEEFSITLSNGNSGSGSLSAPSVALRQDSPSGVLISWGSVSGASTYDIFRDGQYITTNDIGDGFTYLDNGDDGRLFTGVNYGYEVTAVGNGNVSPRSVERFITLTNDIDDRDSDGPKNGGSVAQPNVNDGVNWELIWNDEFESNSLNRDKWRIESLLEDEFGSGSQKAQHQPGVRGFDTQGNVVPGDTPDGKRWAVWYDDHHNRTINVNNGRLEMGAFASSERDPTIKSPPHPYLNPRNNKTADFRDKIFTGWIDTYALTYDRDRDEHKPNPNSPNFYFRYGFVEFGVNFSRVRTDGLRISGWLLPAVNPSNPSVALVGTTYNGNAADGIEIDIWEYEYTATSQNLLLCKGIGAGANNFPAVDCRDFGIDITTGDHTIAIKWTDTYIAWYIDGIEVLRDTGANAIPRIAQALYVTREGNSGVNDDPSNPNVVQPDEPFIQEDAGLWGWNIGTESDSKINNDEAYINYVRVFQDPNQNNNWIAPDWDNGEGIEGVLVDRDIPDDPINPPDEPNDPPDDPINPPTNPGDGVDGGGNPNIQALGEAARNIAVSVRAKDRFGRLSDARSALFTNFPPAQVQNLELQAGIESVFFSFDPVNDDDVAGYRVIRSENSNMSNAIVVYDGLANNGSISGGANGTRYYFQVGAYDKFGSDINYSNTQSVTTTLGDSTQNYIFSDIIFSGNSPSTNRVSWTAGSVAVTGSNGAGNDRQNISAGAASYGGNDVYIYYRSGSTIFSTTTSLATASQPNARLVAVYKGGEDVDSTDGTKPLISGNLLASGIISANHLFAGELITETAQITDGLIDNVHIKNGAIDSAKIGDLQVDTIKIANGAVTSPEIHAGPQFLTFESFNGWNAGIEPPVFSIIVPTTGETQNVELILDLSYSYMFETRGSASSSFANFYAARLQVRFQTPRDRTRPFGSSNSFGAWTNWESRLMGGLFLTSYEDTTGGSFAGTDVMTIPPGSQVEFRFEPDTWGPLFDDRSDANFDRGQMFRPRLKTTVVMK